MISYPFPPNSSAGAVRTERFARYLAEYGWNAEVITIGRREAVFHDEKRLTRFPKSVSISTTSIWDPWLWLYRRPVENKFNCIIRSALMRLTSFPDHMIFWVPNASKKAIERCRTGKIHAIYTTSPPHSTHLCGMYVSKKTGIPWIADFRDPWTLNASRNGTGNIADSIERNLETRVLKNASIILANTETNRTNLLKSFTFLPPEKVRLVNNG